METSNKYSFIFNLEHFSLAVNRFDEKLAWVKLAVFV